MQKSKIKNQKFKDFKICILILIFGFWILNFIGCATVPPSRFNLPTYTINGIRYVPLLSLCKQRDISWDYDIFTKTIILERDYQRLVLRLGDSNILVNGIVKDLGLPVELYRGIVVLPYQLKERFLDRLFKDYPLQRPKPYTFSKIKKIIIDAGHGGHDPGAIGKSGLREKDVALDIARRLAKYLESQGKEAILTRSTDTFISLPRRAEIANRHKADLFVSIHANASRSRMLSGFEVYTLSSSVDDTARAVVFAKNNPLKLEEAHFYNTSLDLKATIWDMLYVFNRQESLELSKHILHQVSSNLGVKTNGAKEGPFYVLKWTEMPAVLVEVGYLSNVSEEKLLRNSFYRQQLAEQIANGILNYSQDFTSVTLKKTPLFKAQDKRKIESDSTEKPQPLAGGVTGFTVANTE